MFSLDKACWEAPKFMKITVTPLKRPSRDKRQGLHYHICIRVDVLFQHVPTLVQYLVEQTTHLVGHCSMSYRYFPRFNVLKDASYQYNSLMYCMMQCISPIQ